MYYENEMCVCVRAERGDGERLLENDLGAEHCHHCHGDQPEGEEGGTLTI